MGILYVVATPIGNLKDVSLRALETLKKVDYILSEDTRVGRKLLEHNKIKASLRSYHEHNELSLIPKVVADLCVGKNVALISNAGAPLISDPGFKLVRTCIENKIEVVDIPGPSSVLTSLIVSGLPTDKFCFYGFLPNKKGKREKALEKIASLYSDTPMTIIFFESRYRIVNTLEMMGKVFGKQTKVSVAAELTKKYERIYRGTLDKVTDRLTKSKILKGEFTITVYLN